MRGVCTYAVFDRALYQGDRPTRESLIGIAIVSEKIAAARLLNQAEADLPAGRIELVSSYRLGKEGRGWLDEFRENSRDG